MRSSPDLRDLWRVTPSMVRDEFERRVTSGGRLAREPVAHPYMPAEPVDDLAASLPCGTNGTECDMDVCILASDLSWHPQLSGESIRRLSRCRRPTNWHAGDWLRLLNHPNTSPDTIEYLAGRHLGLSASQIGQPEPVDYPAFSAEDLFLGHPAMPIHVLQEAADRLGLYGHQSLTAELEARDIEPDPRRRLMNWVPQTRDAREAARPPRLTLAGSPDTPAELLHDLAFLYHNWGTDALGLNPAPEVGNWYRTHLAFLLLNNPNTPTVAVRQAVKICATTHRTTAGSQGTPRNSLPRAFQEPLLKRGLPKRPLCGQACDRQCRFDADLPAEAPACLASAAGC